MLHHAIRTYYPAIWAAHDGDRIAAGVGVGPDGAGEPWPPRSGGPEREAALQAMYLDWIKEVRQGAWRGVGG